jgi:hypothetical protein
VILHSITHHGLGILDSLILIASNPSSRHLSIDRS